MEDDSVAQEGGGSNEKRFEDKSMKRSFILDNEKKAVTSASDKNLGNFYFHFLNGGQIQTKKEVL